MTLAHRVAHGLATAEALTWGALTYRAHLLPFWTRRKRREIEHDHDRDGVLEVPVPFALNQPDGALRAAPGPRAEWFVFQWRLMAANGGRYQPDAVLEAWRGLDGPPDGPDAPRLSASQRAAQASLRVGVAAPRSGHDHPRYADDAGTVRALAIAAVAPHDRNVLAAAVAADAALTNAEDGVWVAQAAAAALAVLAAGAPPAAAVAAALEQLPEDSWAAERARHGLVVGGRSAGPVDLALRLDAEVANAAYSYGDAAPDVLAIALPILLRCSQQPDAALLAAVGVPRHAHAVAPLVGAWLGAAGSAPSASGRRATTLLGVALPRLRGADLDGEPRGAATLRSPTERH